MGITYFIIFACYCIIMGCMTSKLAKQKNKDSVVGFFSGLLFGLFGMLYYGFSEKELTVNIDLTMRVVIIGYFIISFIGILLTI